MGFDDYWSANQNEDFAPIFHLRASRYCRRNGQWRINIIDYKTGSIYDSETLDIKDSYVTQIKLYGQMWPQTAISRHSISPSLSDLSLLLDGLEGDVRLQQKGVSS